MNAFFGRLRAGGARMLGEPAPLVFEGVQTLFAGYLANRVELLDALGPPSSSCSDAELAARAHRCWGDAAPQRLRGEYALASYDERGRTLLLAHDQLGLVPLFYATHDGEIAFASRLEDLIALAGMGPIDERYIADFFAGVEAFADATPFENLKRVRPGECVLFGSGRLRRSRTYTPPNIPAGAATDDRELEAECRRLVVEAIASAMPAGGETWSELSGGLDSSTVVSVAAGVLGIPLSTFSAVFGRSRSADETPWIDAVLDVFALPSHRVDADAVAPFTLLPERFFAEPSSGVIVAAFDRARYELYERHDVRVVLTGSGGDAVFGGDSPEPYFLADDLPWRPRRLFRELATWQRAARDRRSTAFWLQQYALVPHLRRRQGKRIVREPPLPLLFAPEYAQRARLRERAERSTLRGFAIGTQYYWERVQRGALLAAEGQRFVPPGCAYRNPLLYLPLVEFMAGVPWPQRVRPELDRDLQRRALRGILPERIRMRLGKRSSAEAILRGLHDGPWEELLTSRSIVVERGYVEHATWLAAVRSARAGAPRSLPAFLRICMLEAWFAMLDRAPARRILGEETVAAG